MDGEKPGDILEFLRGDRGNKNINKKAKSLNGRKMSVQRMGNTISESQQMCPKCRGEGCLIKNEDICTVCKRNKVNK